MGIREKVKKILIVDDDIDLLEQNKLLLENKGFNVLTCESGEEAWMLYQNENPDAVVADLIMEHHDSGFVLCHKIKKTEHGKVIPVFILTSATYDTGFKFSASTFEERDWINCDAILNKPVSVEEIIKKLEKYFSI